MDETITFWLDNKISSGFKVAEIGSQSLVVLGQTVQIGANTVFDSVIAGGLAGLSVGLVGLVVAVKPALWVSLFTTDPGVTASANSYFAWAGPAFAFFGVGACLYFASQGAAKVGGPVLAYTARLAMVAVGGWWLASIDAPAWTLFALVGGGMGLGTALSVRLARWGK